MLGRCENANISIEQRNCDEKLKVWEEHCENERKPLRNDWEAITITYNGNEGTSAKVEQK